MDTTTKIAVLFILIGALILMCFDKDAEAQVQAQKINKKVSVLFMNKCPDLPPEAFVKPTSLQGWEALSILWSCLNITQASQSSEVVRKVKQAIKNTKPKKEIVVCSVDPDCNEDECIFGAKKSKTRGCTIDYADMPGCPNARRVLEKVIRDERY